MTGSQRTNNVKKVEGMKSQLTEGMKSQRKE